jgi:hypothetical protein
MQTIIRNCNNVVTVQQPNKRRSCLRTSEHFKITILQYNYRNRIKHRLIKAGETSQGWISLQMERQERFEANLKVFTLHHI